MLWHANGYGYRLWMYIHLLFFVQNLSCYSNISYNLVNGFSAVAPRNDLFMALFSVVLINFFILGYQIFSSEVDKSRFNNNNLGFSMPKYYIHCRKENMAYLKRHVMLWIYTCALGFLVHLSYVAMEQEASIDHGRQFGLQAYAYYWVVYLVNVNHIVCLMVYPQFDLCTLFWFAFSYSWIWIISAIVNVQNFR